MIEEIIAKAAGRWTLESSEIGGAVYKPPEASGLMILTEQGSFIHVVTPKFALSEISEWRLEGTKLVAAVNSLIYVNFPPGREGTITSAEPQPSEAQVSVEGNKISFEISSIGQFLLTPGLRWAIEENSVTVGMPGVFLDTWKRAEPGGLAAADRG